MYVEVVEPKLFESLLDSNKIVLDFFDVLESTEVFLLAKFGVVIVDEYDCMPVVRGERLTHDWVGFFYYNVRQESGL